MNNEQVTYQNEQWIITESDQIDGQFLHTLRKSDDPQEPGYHQIKGVWDSEVERRKQSWGDFVASTMTIQTFTLMERRKLWSIQIH